MPAKGAAGLSGTYKIGAWYNSEEFDSLSTASNGVSLADPRSSGSPRQLSGNFAIYGLVDQTLWQKPGSTGNGLNGFVRMTIAPLQDRSSMNRYFDMGLAYKGLLPGRDDDTAGVSFAYAKLSSGASDMVRAESGFAEVAQPTPSSEAVIEATYQAAVTTWLSAQPFFQYVIRPSGNAPDPDKPN